jgi:hypothetical protein
MVRVALITTLSSPAGISMSRVTAPAPPSGKSSAWVSSGSKKTSTRVRSGSTPLSVL